MRAKMLRRLRDVPAFATKVTKDTRKVQPRQPKNLTCSESVKAELLRYRSTVRK